MLLSPSRTQDAARSKWRGILMTMGIDARYLKNKHGPCPVCHGKDRFRFDDKGGNGTWICSNCGAGDGFELAKLYLNLDFLEVARQVDDILKNKPIPVDPVRPELSDERRRENLRALWRKTAKMQKGDLADLYLTARHVGQASYVDDLRFGDHVPDGEGGVHPVMVAMVRDPEGNPATMHRTFLDRSGKRKAQIASPRKMMPGAVPAGSCIRLMDWCAPMPLGIAEGIESAFAAADQFKMPVWSAINAHMLENWQWPDGCQKVVIFADADVNYVGQAAAFALAKRVAMKGLDVEVNCPGMDINREYFGFDFQDMSAQLRAMGET